MKMIRVAQVVAQEDSGRLFTGPVTRQKLITGEESKQFNVNQVNFAKGVRNKFHTHTSDQVIIVTSGKGICATETQEITVFPEDVVLFPAGEKHWHGAAKDHPFSHITVSGTGNKTSQIEE